MKNKAKALSIVLFLSAFLMVVLFGGQKAEWKGKIEVENGVKVIINPRDPLYGKIEFELEEDLSIGREGDENYMFTLVVDIGVDMEGNILGRSYSSSRKGRTLDIVLIDSEGKKLKTIASFPDPRAFVKKGNIRIPGSTRYDPRLYFYPLREEFGVYGYSSEYRLFIINSAGEISHIIEKEEPRQTVTQKEKDRIIKEHMKR